MQFFCDESGQTGSNYLDSTQPFYILGGWLKPDDINSEKFKTELASIIAGKEIKASRLVKNPKGRATLLKLIKLAINYNLIPVYCIVEKRFAISARMVDELLDPEYNDFVPYSITYDEWGISKYDLAIMFYGLPDDIINEFAKSYSNHDISGIMNSVNRMVIYFDNSKYKPLSEIINNSLRCINDNPSFFNDDNDHHIFSHKIDKKRLLKV